MKFDTRSLPAPLSGDFAAARSEFAAASEPARREVTDTRRARYADRTLKRIQGVCGASERDPVAIDVRDVTVLDGHAAPALEATPTITALADELEAGFVRVGGYGSVFDVGYVLYDAWGPYIEVMDPTAFDRSLAAPGLRMSLLTQHDSLGLAETTAGRFKVAADSHGLAFAAALNDAEPSALDVVNKLASGSTSSDTSVAGYINEYQWDDDYMVVTILDWGLHRGEISVVHAGANPAGYVMVLDDDPQRDDGDDVHSSLGAIQIGWHKLQSMKEPYDG